MEELAPNEGLLLFLFVLSKSNMSSQKWIVKLLKMNIISRLKVLNNTKLVVNDHLGLIWYYSEQVSWLGFFLRFLQQDGSSNFFLSYYTPNTLI